MEDFIQSSRENGVFSIRSMVSKMTELRDKLITLTVAQIPQKVLKSVCLVDKI
jgi:hypothetical protein